MDQEATRQFIDRIGNLERQRSALFVAATEVEDVLANMGSDSDFDYLCTTLRNAIAEAKK